MANVGADLEKLKELARAIKTLNDSIQSNRPAINSLVKEHGIWVGPAADKFRNEWTSEFDKALNTISNGLTDAEKAVKVHLDNIARATGVAN